MLEQNWAQGRQIAEAGQIEWAKHGNFLHLCLAAHGEPIAIAGQAKGQGIEDNAHHDLAGSHSDVHPGQQKGNQHSCGQRTGQPQPGTARVEGHQKTGQRAQQHGSLNANVEDPGAFAKNFAE